MSNNDRLKGKIITKNTTSEVPFEEDQTSPMADDVKDFLNNKEEEKPIEIPDDIKEMLGDKDSGEEEISKDRIKIAPDNTFENSDAKTPFSDMFVSVKDTEIPVTEEDKTDYIKATLFDNPVILTIKAKNGTSAKCRTLTAYESDICYEALGLYLKKYPNYPSMLWTSLMQQFRFPIQVLEYCGKEQKSISFKYEHGKKEEFAEQLIELSDARMADVPYPAYNNRIRLLNVFNNKIALLQSATFNSDFWNPDDIG